MRSKRIRCAPDILKTQCSLKFASRCLSSEHGLAWELRFERSGQCTGYEVTIELPVLSPARRVFAPSNDPEFDIRARPTYRPVTYATNAWQSGYAYVLPLITLMDPETDHAITVALPPNVNIPHLQFETSGGACLKIEEVKTWLVEGIKYNWTLIKIYTDEGLTGIGEATNWPGSPLVVQACKHVGEMVVGEDPSRIDYLWTKLYRNLNWMGQAGPLLDAISAIDIALWDIAGKRARRPIYELLGGAYRKQIPLYANYWFLSPEGAPQDYARQAGVMAAQGFSACKFDPFTHTNYTYGEDLATNLSLTEAQKALAIDRLIAVQEALGPEFPIAVETHAMLNGPTAVEMAHRIENAKIHCMWYEEPAGPEFPDAIAEIKRQISLPVCVGERLHSRFMCRPILELHAADILMPDITRCGGISEMRKIANLCECYNVPVAPHNPNGPISTIAAAHVMAAVPNFLIQELIVTDVPWRDTILDKPLPIRQGVYRLSDEPGLGFDLVEEEVERHAGIQVPRPGYYV